MSDKIDAINKIIKKVIYRELNKKEIDRNKEYLEQYSIEELTTAFKEVLTYYRNSGIKRYGFKSGNLMLYDRRFLFTQDNDKDSFEKYGDPYTYRLKGKEEEHIDDIVLWYGTMVVQDAHATFNMRTGTLKYYEVD